MGIGAYRHFVTLEHPAVVLDPDTWYCALQSAATQVIDGQAAYFVRGRYHPGLTLETQIHFEGRTFQVQGITDLDERHVEVQLLCVEVVARGRAPVGPPVTGAPVITAPPVGGTIASGESVTLTVVASGTSPLTYQWRKDGVAIAGATQQFYVTGPLTVTTVYAVTVTNDYGAVTSAPATVAIPLTYQSQVVADGASNYWPLDDPSGTTARNLVMANPGTITGGVTLNQPGVGTSKAMEFDGTTGYIQLPTLPALAPTMTLEVWANTRSLPTGSTVLRYIADIQPSIVATALSTRSPAQYFEYSTYKVGGGYIGGNTGEPDLALATWYHLVVTADGTTVTVYLNGVMKSQVAGGVLGGASTWRIGSSHYPDANNMRWDGLLQDVAIYPRALTPAEIANHYTIGLAR